MLSVYAYDYIAYVYNGVLYPLHPNAYVDGNLVGTASISIPVISGSHTLTLSSTVYDPYWGQTASFVFMVDQNGNRYSNGASVPVNSPLAVAAWYYP
jgi:hypothetical protein